MVPFKPVEENSNAVERENENIWENYNWKDL